MRCFWARTRFAWWANQAAPDAPWRTVHASCLLSRSWSESTKVAAEPRASTPSPVSGVALGGPDAAPVGGDTDSPSTSLSSSETLSAVGFGTGGVLDAWLRSGSSEGEARELSSSLSVSSPGEWSLRGALGTGGGANFVGGVLIGGGVAGKRASGAIAGLGVVTRARCLMKLSESEGSFGSSVSSSDGIMDATSAQAQGGSGAGPKTGAGTGVTCGAGLRLTGFLGGVCYSHGARPPEISENTP